MKTFRKSFFSLMSVTLIKKNILNFLIDLGAGCSTKEAITASFVEHYKENHENTTCVYFVVVIRILHGKTNTTW